MKKEKNIEGYYKGLEKKIIGIFLVFLVIPFAIFSIISLGQMKEISYNVVHDSKVMGASAVNDSREIGNTAINESKNALENQTELYLQQLAISEAINFNNFLVNIEEKTETIADYARDLFSSDSGGTCFSDRVMVSVPITKESLDELFISTDRIDTSTLNLIKFYLDNPYETLNKNEFFLIKKALKDPGKKVVNKAYCMDKMLKPIADNDPYVSWAYMGFNNGVTVLYPYDENPAIYDPRKRGWYIKAVEYNKTIWTDIYVDAGGAGLMITSATPVYSNKNLIGVIGVDVTLETLNHRILSINIENGYAFVIDKQGKIIFHPDLERGETRWYESFETDNLLETNNTELRQIIVDMTSGNTGYGKIDFEGGEKYIAYAPINTTSWSIGIVVPDREIIKSAIVTKQKIENATNQISNDIDQTTKHMSTDINEKTNIMQNLFLWMILFSIGIISIAAIYLGRNVRYYGDKITESEKKYRYLFENANYAVYTINKLGIMESFNPEAERMGGYKAEEVIGKNFKIFFSDKEIQKAEYLFKSAVKEGKSICDYELLVKHKQGYEFPIEININPLYNKEGTIVGLQGIAIDISERKQMELQLEEYTEKLEQKVKERTKELAELKEFNEAIIENINTNIIVVNKDFIVTKVNKAQEKNYKIKREDLIGKNILDLNPKLKEEGFDKLIKEVLKTKKSFEIDRWEHETLKLGKRCINLKTTPLLNSDGDAIGAILASEDVTEKVKLDQEIKETKAYLEHLINSSADSIITTDLEGNIVSWNKSAERIYGWSAEEVIGKKIHDILIPPDLSKEANEITEKLKQNIQVKGYDTVRTRKDGTLIDISLTVSPIYDCYGKVIGLSGISRDITDKKKKEAEIKYLEKLYETITQGIPSAVILHDKEIRIIFVNHQFTKITELTKEEVLGKTPFENLPEFAIKEMGLREKLYRVRDYGEIIGSEEIFYNTKSGKEIILEHRVYPLLDEKGSTQYILTVLDDITEKKRLEEQLIQSEKMALIGELASGIAHNLRSPLAAIKGIPELILEDIESGYIKVIDEKGNDYEPIKEQLHLVINSTKKCLEIIKNIMSFSRPKESKELVSIVQVIDSALELIGNLLIKNKIEIIKDIKDYKVYGNKNQLMQVFINLFTNAKDAMPDCGKLHISSNIMDEYGEIKVQDTGIGIKKEIRDRIFEPFFTTKGNAEGSGIGLSMSQKIILEHNGSITVESEVGKGATFTIKLPIRGKG